MSHRAVRVLVFSTVSLFREGLCTLLEQSAAIARVSSAGDWDGVLSSLYAGGIDTVIIDRDGEAPESAIDDLFAISPHLRIVLVSSQDNRLTVIIQLPAGDVYQPLLIAEVAQSGGS
jgi:DNA-binding NarL/FixJ family response regulator